MARGRKLGLTSRATQESSASPTHLRRADGRHVRRRRRRDRTRRAARAAGRSRARLRDGRRPRRPGRHHRPTRSPPSVGSCRQSRSPTAGSRTGGYGIVDTVADNAAAARVVLGVRMLPIGAFDLRLVGVLFHRNGIPVDSGAGAAAMGNPARCLAWLANTLGPLGSGLRSGDIVLSGAAAPDGPGPARRRLPGAVRAPRRRHRAVRERAVRRRSVAMTDPHTRSPTPCSPPSGSARPRAVHPQSLPRRRGRLQGAVPRRRAPAAARRERHRREARPDQRGQAPGPWHPRAGLRTADLGDGGAFRGTASARRAHPPTGRARARALDRPADRAAATVAEVLAATEAVLPGHRGGRHALLGAVPPAPTRSRTTPAPPGWCSARGPAARRAGRPRVLGCVFRCRSGIDTAAGGAAMGHPAAALVWLAGRSRAGANGSRKGRSC